MSSLPMTITIELSPDIMQSDVWDLEEKLQQIDGLTTDVLESKDFLSVTILSIHFVASIMGDIAVIGGSIKVIYETSKMLFEFLHKSSTKKSDVEAKKKVVLIKKGRRIELYNLSMDEIEKLLDEK